MSFRFRVSRLTFIEYKQTQLAMKNILVPTDFSENSFNALKYSVQLFKKHRCTFYLLHVNPVPIYSNMGTAIKPSEFRPQNGALEESRIKLKDWVGRIQEILPNTKHTFLSHTVHDYFVDAIKREVYNRGIDLIVMGCKGASEVKHAALGTNTGNVITKVKCALLAVPEEAIYQKPMRIAFPTDYHLGYDINVLENLLGIVQLNQSALHIVHYSRRKEDLSQDQLTNKEFLDDYFKDVEHSFFSLGGSNLDGAVDSFSEERSIDMIAMVAKNLNFFQKILFKPALDEISYHTKIPFFILHEKSSSNSFWSEVNKLSKYKN